MKKYTILLLMTLIWCVCCTLQHNSLVNELKDSIIYSGLWRDINSDLPPNAIIIQSYNCEIKIINKDWFIRPLSVGQCFVQFKKKKNQSYKIFWNSIQVPDPLIRFGPKSGGDILIDWKNPSSLTLYPTLAHLGDKIFYESPGKLFLYKPPPNYEIASFTINIFDKDKALLYTKMEFADFFSCESANAYYDYSSKKGTNIIIEDIEVYYPDNTSKVFKMDTLRF